METNFRMVLNPKTRLFEVTFIEANPTILDGGFRQKKTQASIRKQWELSATEAEQLVKMARQQLVDTTDATIQFTLQVKDYKINFNGIASKQAFEGIVDYLEKVWGSFKQSRFYREVHPQ